MKRSVYSEARDARTADAVLEESAQMCPAKGCPHRWSCMGSQGKACGAHYFAPRSEWPTITERLQRIETDRARAAELQDPGPMLTRDAKRAILERLRRLGRDPGSDRGWALWLQQQHDAGAKLTRFQIDAYRQTLRLEARELASHLPLPKGVQP